MARFFINRPIVAMVISIVTVLLGVVAMSGLPIAQYPEIVPPMVQVTTTFVGASATDVEASVATPAEQKINGVENSIYMKSTNANDGTLTLKVSFDVGSNLDMANVLTQNKLSEAMPQLPASVKTYGVAVKKALAFPLLVISIKSPNGTYDNNFLSNYTTINIQDNLARIKGVGQINLFGGSDYAMRVWLRPDRIARLGITVPDIVNAISQQNTLSPSGQFGGQPAVPDTEFTYTVRTQGRLLERGGVRRGHRALEPGRLAGPPEGRGADRARHAALQRRRPARRQARGGPRRLPDPRHERPRRWPRTSRPTLEDAVDALPAGPRVQGLARHDAAGRGGHQRDRPHARSRRSSSSSSWSSSSCRTGGRR